MTPGDTIVAPATPFGYSGVAVLRMSGADALSILSNLSGKHNFVRRQATLSSLKDQHGNLIDRCLVTVFMKPNSYTGEDVVEISTHGNPSTVEDVVSAVCALGGRPAEAGEFTRRAFINGKMDLIQVEAVASLINSKSVENSRCQQKILGGTLSKTMHSLRDRLIVLLSGFEYQMDISEEDLRPSEKEHIHEELREILTAVNQFESTFYLGRLLNRGATVVIAGEPNVGKSTLLNCLADSSRAIVSDTPGTTRDTIEVELLIGGAPVRFVDTAGIRDSNDSVEKEGVRRTREHIKKADLILSLTDDPKSNHILKTDMPILKVVNKSDKHRDKMTDKSIIHISAINNLGVALLKEKISKALGVNKISTEATYLSTTRQHNAITLCSSAVNNALDLFVSSGLDVELLSFEIRTALDAIDSILGRTSPDEILNHVFGSLCVGK